MGIEQNMFKSKKKIIETQFVHEFKKKLIHIFFAVLFNSPLGLKFFHSNGVKKMKELWVLPKMILNRMGKFEYIDGQCQKYMNWLEIYSVSHD